MARQLTRVFVVVLAFSLVFVTLEFQGRFPKVKGDITTGFVGWWKFDEGSGTATYDSSGYNNHGAIQGGATYVDGEIGEALYFDGGDDFVWIEDSTSISSPSATGAITVSAWVKPDVGLLDRYARVVASHWYDGQGTSADCAWVLEAHDDGQYHAIISAGDGANYVDLPSNTPVQEGSWQHLAFTWDGSTVTFYFNGNVDATTTYTLTLSDSSRPLQIGKTDTFYYVWKGIIDEVRLYNRALSGDEIRTIMGSTTHYVRTYIPNEWIGGGTPMGWHEDDASWQYELPFDFPFYGTSYRTIYISSNGLITFAGPDSDWGNSIEGLAGKLAIAPAWDDWMTDGSFDIYVWQPDSSHIIVRWEARVFGSSVVANFETMMSVDGVIQFNYGYNDGPISATAGISNGADDILAEEITSSDYIQSIVFTPTGAPSPTGYYAVIAGEGYTCAYADVDAYELYDVLTGYPNWDPASIVLLVSTLDGTRHDCTRASIQSGIAWMADVADGDDVCLFFYSGHGTYLYDEPPYDEVDGYDECICPEGGNILDDELDLWMSAISGYKLVVLDSCFSGGFIKANGLISRSVSGMPMVEIADGFAEDLSQTGFNVHTACDEHEYAYSSDELQNGVFTYYLIGGLLGPADLDVDGDVDALEAHYYAAPLVQDYTGYVQNPQFFCGTVDPLIWVGASIEVHDVAVVDVLPSKTVVGQGYEADVNVTVTNYGSYQETFNVTLYAQPADLVGYLKFDEGSGTTAHDSSGNNNTGTLINGPQWVDGKYGKAMSFDGVNDYVAIPHSNSLDFERTDSFTISSWITVDSLSDYRNIIGKNDNAYRGWNLILLSSFDAFRPNSVCLVLTNTNIYNDLLACSPANSISAGNTYHIAATYNGSSDISGVKIYINGVPQTVTPIRNGLSASIQTTNETWIGRHGWAGGSYPFDGIIDDIRIYNRALTANEIWTEYAGSVGHWKLDEGSGTTAYDSSGNGNDGIVNGATWITGRLGNALSFDGANDYVNITDSDSLDLTIVTMAAWVKTSSMAPEIIISKGKDWTETPVNYLLVSANNRVYVDWQGGYSGTDETGLITDGNWHHVVGILNNIANSTSVYIDGVQRNCTRGGSNTNVNMITNNLPLLIGDQSSTWHYYFNGTIDEVKIYNRTLTAEEIWAEYASAGFVIGTQSVILNAGSSTTITFTWDTSGWAKGNYTLTAIADTVPSETDTTDNSHSYDVSVHVAMLGDIAQEFSIVDILDCVVVALHFNHIPPDAHLPATPEHVACFNADINNDQIVDIFDIVVVALHFGEVDP